MKGAIAGDIIGSVYEWDRIKTKEFELFSNGSQFTDDSVLTIAIADAVLKGTPYKESILSFARKYPGRGYGGMFSRWIKFEDPQPYNSFGNGSAMRISAVGFAFNDEKKILHEAAESAWPTHNHPEGIKGAQATALSIFLARKGKSKVEIKKKIEDTFGYNLNRSLDQIRPSYMFDETCQGTVPEAIIAFLESSDFEDAIRNAISLGGDSDTLACITGGIAEAYYKGLPKELEARAMPLLNEQLRSIVDAFYNKFVD